MQQPALLPQRQSLLAALVYIQAGRQTRTQTCTVHGSSVYSDKDSSLYCTPLEAILTLLDQLSPYSEHLYCPASAEETEWIEHPTTVTTLASLFPDYSHSHLVSLCIWLGIPGSFSHGRSMFASLIFVTVVMHRQVENGSSSVVFGRRWKTSENICGRTQQRYLKCDANLNLSYFVLCWQNEFKAWKGFFRNLSFLLWNGRTQYWLQCVISIFILSLDKKNLPQS